MKTYVTNNCRVVIRILIHILTELGLVCPKSQYVEISMSKGTWMVCYFFWKFVHTIYSLILQSTHYALEEDSDQNYKHK